MPHKPVNKMEERELRREIRHLRKTMRQLVDKITIGLATLDKVMLEPGSRERGSKVAKISNYMEMAKDSARFFGLHDPIRRNKDGTGLPKCPKCGKNGPVKRSETTEHPGVFECTGCNHQFCI